MENLNFHLTQLLSLLLSNRLISIDWKKCVTLIIRKTLFVSITQKNSQQLPSNLNLHSNQNSVIASLTIHKLIFISPINHQKMSLTSIISLAINYQQMSLKLESFDLLIFFRVLGRNLIDFMRLKLHQKRAIRLKLHPKNSIRLKLHPKNYLQITQSILIMKILASMILIQRKTSTGFPPLVLLKLSQPPLTMYTQRLLI